MLKHQCRTVDPFPSATVPGIVEQEKKLYLWNLSHLHRFAEPMVANMKRGRCFTISGSDIKRQLSIGLPTMSLKSTAKYFVAKLSPDDKELLASTMALLDGKCIRFASTCSGTDVISPVMKHTFAALSELFDAPMLLHILVVLTAPMTYDKHCTVPLAEVNNS